LKILIATRHYRASRERENYHTFSQLQRKKKRLKSIMAPPSYGGVRLANWDVVRLATKIKSGDIVSIR
jgi:lipoprotein-anchoring transpeptidase ErfK/SrfK